jgi:hypothetical protein
MLLPVLLLLLIMLWFIQLHCRQQVEMRHYQAAWTVHPSILLLLLQLLNLLQVCVNGRAQS